MQPSGNLRSLEDNVPQERQLGEIKNTHCKSSSSGVRQLAQEEGWGSTREVPGQFPEVSELAGRQQQWCVEDNECPYSNSDLSSGVKE